MEILKIYPETLTTRERFILTSTNNIRKMRTAVNSVLEVAAYALYTDFNRKDGTINEVLSVQTLDGEIYATISPTFKEYFLRIVEIFGSAGETLPPVKVVSGESKNGNTFISCTIV